MRPIGGKSSFAGGKSVLLEFPLVKEARQFLENDTIDFGIIFDWVNLWNSRDIAKERLVWLGVQEFQFTLGMNN